MKKTYTAPTVEITRYDVEDVLLVSGMGMRGLLADIMENEKMALSTWLNSK